MTTIVYKDRKIAYDSLMVNGGRIRTDNYEKMEERAGVYFFIAGCTCDGDYLMESYLNFEFGITTKKFDCNAFVFDNGFFFHFAYDDDSGCPFKEELSCPDALGSGAPYALAAIHLGADIKEAISVSITLDLYTGGNIRVFDPSKIMEAKKA